MEHKIFGDYVLTAIPNAFNKKTSWWLSKKDCTVAMYCFTTEGSERQQLAESKYQIECIETYIHSYEVRFSYKQDVEKKKKTIMGTNISFTTTEGPDATQFDTTDTAELLGLFHTLLVESNLTLVSVESVETVEIEVD